MIPNLEDDYRTSVSSESSIQSEISVSYSNESCPNSILSNSPYRKSSRSLSTSSEPRKVSFCPHVTARVYVEPGPIQSFEPTSPNKDVDNSAISKRPNLLIWKQKQMRFATSKICEVSQSQQSEDIVGEAIDSGYEINNSQIIKKLIGKLSVFSLKRRQDTTEAFAYNHSSSTDTIIGEYPQ